MTDGKDVRNIFRNWIMFDNVRRAGLGAAKMPEEPGRGNCASGVAIEFRSLAGGGTEGSTGLRLLFGHRPSDHGNIFVVIVGTL